MRRGDTYNRFGFRPVRSSEDSPQREQNSDPAAIPSASPRAVWQTKNARPVPVVAADTATNAPGGYGPRIISFATTLTERRNNSSYSQHSNNLHPPT